MNKKSHKKKKQQRRVRTPEAKNKENYEANGEADEKCSHEAKKGRGVCYDVMRNDVMGRYLVAHCPIAAGSELLCVPALVVGPVGGAGGCGVVCLGCYLQLTTSDTHIHRCPGCSWPLCGPSCPGVGHSLGHSEAECRILVTIPPLYDDPQKLTDQYYFITPLRCLLLKSSSPESWSILLSMESHDAVRRARPDIWILNQRTVVDVLAGQLRLADHEEIHTVCGVLEVNAFEVGGHENSARALFPSAFLLSHSCVPSTSHADSCRPTRTLSVRAAIPHERGDPLTLSYAYTLQGTLRRRSHLQHSKFFWCVCARCSDKTELGTYASALVCPHCGTNEAQKLENQQKSIDYTQKSTNTTQKSSETDQKSPETDQKSPESNQKSNNLHQKGCSNNNKIISDSKPNTERNDPTQKSKHPQEKSNNSSCKSNSSSHKSNDSNHKSENSSLKLENSSLKSENLNHKSKNTSLKSEDSSPKSKNSSLKSENSSHKLNSGSDIALSVPPSVLPVDPLDMESDWKCSHCNYTLKADAVDLLLKRLTDDLDSIDANDVKGFEQFLNKYRNVLHHNHYLNLSAKHSLSQLYGKVTEYMIGDMSEGELLRKVEICRDLMSVFDVIEPGLSRLRGITLYELHAPLMVLTTREFEKKNITKDNLRIRLKEVVQCLTEAAEILSMEPPDSSEGMMAAAATEALSKIYTWEQIIGKIR